MTKNKNNNDGDDIAAPKMSQAQKLWHMTQRFHTWKEGAMDKQKKNRALEDKVRDLTRSRNTWKEKASHEKAKAKALEQELAALQRLENRTFKQT